MRFITENFKSIDEMIKVLDSRPKNQIMKNCNSSERPEREFTWYGTDSYTEAISLIKKGYTEILPDIKKQVREQSKNHSNLFTVNKRIPQNAVIGYVPNVPNAIRNLPNSMITINKIPQKKKVISIIYSIAGSCGESQEFFIKAGATLLTAIKSLEAQGISVELSVGFMGAKDLNESEAIFPTVKVKSYGQELDLQKLCFPLAHPSMFRRFGFKYLETCPDITKNYFSFSYGTPIKDLSIIKENLKCKNDSVVVLNSYWIRANEYDVKKIVEKLQNNKIINKGADYTWDIQ
jgi:hypothetical protein